MASVVENTGEKQENQTILSQILYHGNEALDEIEKNAKPENTKRATLWGLKKLGKWSAKRN